ncbi:MAG: HAD family hydrolase, partial [Collinsella intestinalis]
MQAVIFDMDGTLIDTERVSQAAWRRAAQDFRIEIPEHILHAFVGCSIPNAMNMIDDEFGDPAFTERLFNRRHEIFDATWEDELELKPGAAEAVAAARATGAAVALATSSVRERA